MFFDFIGRQAARRIVREQYNILDEVELAGYRTSLPSEKDKSLWDKLIAKVRGTDDEPVRVGHIFWIMGVIDGVHPAGKMPSMKLPADAAYSVTTDAGVPHFRKFMLAKVDGKLIAAFDHLRAGAEKFSPLCMSAYGLALLRGDVPGKIADPRAVDWLEKAAKQSRNAMGASDLAAVLLEGTHVAQDIPRGLALFECALQVLPNTSRLAWDLAAILYRGLCGVPCDAERALALVMPQAPWWRRLLAKLGVDQTPWLDYRLRVLDAIKAGFDSQTPWEMQRMAKDLVSGLRKS